MAIPSDPKIVEQLQSGDRVAGDGDLCGFAYDLDLTVPFVATAIHAGHRVRDELQPLMEISEEDRFAEEDAETGQMIRSCPSAVWALDSRAEYDLNRPPDLALPLEPKMFWGMKVYHTRPSDAMNLRTLEKYRVFYKFFASLVHVLLMKFGACVIYDIHSYNIDRQVAGGHAEPPVFNLGTGQIDRPRWRESVDDWMTTLEKIVIPGHGGMVGENVVFEGRGEFCRCLTSWDPNILVLPTEIAKVYIDEQTGMVVGQTVETLQKELGKAIVGHSRRFRRLYCYNA
jgi:hypothetical protein